MPSVPASLRPGTDWIPGDGIPWVCFQCWCILGPSTVPQSVVLRKLHEHVASGHIKQKEDISAEEDLEDQDNEEDLDDTGEQEDEEGDEEDQGSHEDLDGDLQHEGPKIGDADVAPKPTAQLHAEELNPPRQGQILVRCRHCPSSVREDRLESHISRVHPLQTGSSKMQAPVPQPLLPRPTTPTQFALPEVPVERLPFELLRPGTRDIINDAIRHCRSQARNRPALFSGGIVDYGRLEEFRKLRPVKCYTGSESWNGYVVFEFNGTRHVVLECPVEGNATYVLSGDWKRMVGHSKAYLRHEYPNSYTKVVHKGDWLDRVRYAL